MCSGWCPRGAPGSVFSQATLRYVIRWCADTPPHTSTDYRCGFVFGSATGGRCYRRDKTIEGCRTRCNNHPNEFLLGPFEQKDRRLEKQAHTDRNRRSLPNTTNIEPVDFPGLLQNLRQATAVQAVAALWTLRHLPFREVRPTTFLVLEGDLHAPTTPPTPSNNAVSFLNFSIPRKVRRAFVAEPTEFRDQRICFRRRMRQRSTASDRSFSRHLRPSRGLDDLRHSA